MVPAVSAASRRGAKPLSVPPAAVTKERTALAAKAKPAAVAKAGSSARKPKQAVAPPKPLVSEATKTKAEAITSEIATDLPENVENEITKFFGLRYRFGGEGPGGIDCSALIKQVYSEIFGINLPRRSTEQSQMGNLESVDKGELKTGDLVFFGPDRKAVNHVGMYLAGGHFLHAARSEGVTISRLDNSYWKSRYMFSKRARGLDLGDERDEDLEIDKMLAMYSFSSGVGAGHALDNFSFLETGVQLNDSLEFILSGFMMNALETSEAPADPYSSDAIPAESPEFESGFRLAAAISPLEWIRLVPSITQIDEDKQDKGSGRDYQKLGLETWMILPSSKVAVFMAAHARNQEDLFERPLGVSPDWQNMDFALGLHYHLSDSLRFSLWGTQTANTDLRANEEPGRRNSPVEDVSFQFNFRF
jgi:cell wall-associated NlpC family hydrolase